MSKKPTYEQLVQRVRDLERDFVENKQTAGPLKKIKDSYHLLQTVIDTIELENIIERAVINTRGDTLELEEVLDAKRPDDASPSVPVIRSLEVVEREHILLALKTTNWKIHGRDGAAALLDINPSTLRGRLRKQQIERPPYQT